MIDESSCVTTGTGNRMCCQNSGTAMVAGPKGSLKFNYNANGCESSPKKETLKGPIDVTGGSGQFGGAMGTGFMSVTLNPETGKGTIALQANLK
jgi:hypothetical protein